MPKKPAPSTEFSAWDDFLFTLGGGLTLLLPFLLLALALWGLLCLLT